MYTGEIKVNIKKKEVDFHREGKEAEAVVTSDFPVTSRVNNMTNGCG